MSTTPARYDDTIQRQVGYDMFLQFQDTAEEVAAYDEANLPIPDWQGAFQALVKELLPPDRFQDVASQFNLPIDPQ
jgi:hypothetical protein